MYRLLLCILFMGCTNSVTDPVEDSKKEVIYYIYGNAPQVDLSYKDSDGNTKSMISIVIPFTHYMKVDPGFNAFAYASNRYNYGDVRIRLYINNELVSEIENSSAYGTVTLNKGI